MMQNINLWLLTTTIGLYLAWDARKHRVREKRDETLNLAEDVKMFSVFLKVHYFPKNDREFPNPPDFVWKWTKGRWYLPIELVNKLRGLYDTFWLLNGKWSYFYGEVQSFEQSKKLILIHPKRPLDNNETVSQVYHYRDSWGWESFQSFINTYRDSIMLPAQTGVTEEQRKETTIKYIEAMEKRIQTLHHLYKEADNLKKQLIEDTDIVAEGLTKYAGSWLRRFWP